MPKSGFVAIVGRPNVGKSTLLNSILGTNLSIVTPKAQTTRERILGILTEKEGQIVFVDTPGIHRAKQGGINEFMVQEAREAIEATTIVWYLVDPASETKHEQLVLDLLQAAQAPVILLMNKTDVVRSEKDRARLGEFENQLKSAFAERKIPLHRSLWLSARKGRGIEELLRETWAYLPEGPLYYPDEEQISDRPTRFFAAEKVREQLFLQLGDEVPYSCAVEIEKFEEPRPDDFDRKPMTRIEATIHVERDSQKGMVIGKGGQKIKEIGQAARKEIEQFIGGPVFLGLRVKVLKDWTKNAEALKRMGYLLPEKKKS